MRIHVKALASLLTVLMALALVGSREWSDGRGRDSVMRITRGAQRLDATEQTLHGSDDAELVLAPPSVVVTSAVLRLDGPAAPPLPGAPPSISAPTVLSLPRLGSVQPRPLARPARPALGRAPPLA